MISYRKKLSAVVLQYMDDDDFSKLYLFKNDVERV